MIAITTTDNITHHLESEAAIARIVSPNTRAALQAAVDAGHCKAYTPPKVVPEPDPPNWTAFRLTLFDLKSFRQWAATVPADWREDLKLCAALANAEALQSTYNSISALFKPLPTSAAEWQKLATQNRIPVTF